MNWYSLITLVKNILKDDEQLKYYVHDYSIRFSIPQEPVSESDYPILLIQRPSINTTARRGGGEGDALYLTEWNLQVIVQVIDSIEEIDMDFKKLNDIERMVINALIKSDQFNELESDENTFFEIEFTDYEPDLVSEKPFLGGVLTFIIRENYNTNIDVEE